MINQKYFPKILLALCIFVLLNLGGCVRYDLGIDFQHQHQGKIFQTIELSQQFTDFSSAEAQQWLETIKSRAKNLGGTIEQRSPQTVLVTIPFYSSEELESSFNRFFHPNPSTKGVNTEELRQLDSVVEVEHNNLLLAERNHLHLSVDLRALGVLSQQGKLVISPGALLNLQFRLSTPWGARVVDEQNDDVDDVDAVESNQNGLVWQLQPGEINTIDLVYWLPSRIGIGGLIILGLIWLGAFLKYGLLRNQTSFSVPPLK